MAEFNGFHELGEELSDLAEDFREDEPVAQDPETGQFQSTKGAIQAGVNEAMDDIVEISRAKAREYVPGEHADTIQHESLGWMNKKYIHKFYSESDIVTFHEFGTGTKAEHPRYPGTVNAESESGRRGYLIEPPGDQPVAFRDEGNTFVLDYVVHPGVPAQHFMQRTLRRNTDRIKDATVEKLEERFNRISN